MKKLAILVVACALAVGAAACGKKKDTSTPATTGETGETGTGDMGSTGGDAYGGDAYGAPADPCAGDEANPCGG
ncbi:MAG: hypothetical protein K8M05_37540 [Deltaproteobacteria bacterium]|nr:hypothetical protein [Kofleriaceae bacterium]